VRTGRQLLTDCPEKRSWISAGGSLQHNLQDFLRRGGGGQYVVTRRNGAVYGCRADMSIKSLLPGDAEMRAAFTDKLDRVIAENTRMLLNALTLPDTVPWVAQADLRDVSDAKDEALRQWEARLTALNDAYQTHPQRLRPLQTHMEERLLRAFAGLINQLRQQDLGIETYIWRSRDDAKVRDRHAEYDDKVFRWDTPPEGGHPGQAYNCRCYAEPVAPGSPNQLVVTEYVPGTGGLPQTRPSRSDIGNGLRALTRGGLAAVAAVGLEALRRYADEAAVQRSADLLGLDLLTVEGVLAARAHAWGQFHSGAFSGADWSGPSSEIVAQALALHELSDPGALGRALAGNQEYLARIQGIVGQALKAWGVGQLAVRPGELASGWTGIFPQLDEFGRDILDLPGFSTEGYQLLGGTSSPHVVENRTNDEPRSLPGGVPETDAEGRPVEPAPEGRGLPPQGRPGTWVVGPRGDRLYGPDGKPIKDVDWGHDHGQGQPHTHEWIDGVRQPGRPATEEESFSGEGRGDDGLIRPEDRR
jgi:SPP1 gp7 family putative phage head morphogenesis protein